MSSSVSKRAFFALVVVVVFVGIVSILAMLDSQGPVIRIIAPDLQQANTPQGSELSFDIIVSDRFLVNRGSIVVEVDGVNRDEAVEISGGRISGALALTDGTHTLRVAARDQAGNDSIRVEEFEVLNRLSTLANLAAANNSKIFAPRFDEYGILRSLGGGNAAPECSYEGQLTRDRGEAMAHCFLNTNAALLSGGESAQDANHVRVTQISPNSDGSGVVKMRQFVGDVPVGGSEIALMLGQGKVIHAGGSFVPASKLPGDDVPVFGRAVIETDAEAISEKNLRFKRRYYSMSRGAPISEFGVEPEGATTLAFDERTREVFFEYTDAAFEISRLVPRLPYGLDVPAPTAADADRIWINAPVGPPDMQRVILRDKADCADGVIPAVVDNWSVDEMGGASIGFDVDVPCEDPDPAVVEIGIPNTTDLDAMGLAAGNLAFWMEDLARFANSTIAEYNSPSDFPWANWFPRVLKVHLYRKLFPTKHVPVAVPRQDDIASETNLYWPEDNTVVGGWHTSLRTIAHEYGHHVAYSYGYSAHLGGGLHVTEGWANHNVLRYGLYRLRERALRTAFDPVTSLTPTERAVQVDEDLTVTESPYNSFLGPSHTQRLVDGEFVPRNRRGDDNLMFYDFFEGDPYLGSYVIGIVYWELVWDRMRASFQTHNIGDDIFSGCGTVPPAGNVADAMSPVNRAFTRAIQVMPQFDGTEHWGSGTVDHIAWFMEFVMAGLIQEVPTSSCNITAQDLERVAAVMAHHCLGPLAQYCSDAMYAILPGKHYSVGASQHASFPADDSHLVPGVGFATSNGATLLPSSGLADADSVVRLNGGTATFTVSAPSDGFYQLRLAIRSPAGSAITVTNGTTTIQRVLPPMLETAWTRRFELTLVAGLNTISIDESQSNTGLLLLAAVLDGRCVPVTCGGAVCGSESSDGCGHAMSCPDCTLANLGWLDCDSVVGVETPPGDPARCGTCSSSCPATELCLFDACEGVVAQLRDDLIVGNVDGTDDVVPAPGMAVPGLGGFQFFFPGSQSYDLSDLKVGSFVQNNAIDPVNVEVGFHEGSGTTSFDYQVRRQELPEMTIVREFDDCARGAGAHRLPIFPAGYVPVLLGFDLDSSFIRPIANIRAELYEDQGRWWFGYSLSDSNGGEGLCFRVAYGLVPESRVIGSPVVAQGTVNATFRDVPVALDSAVMQGFEVQLTNSQQVHMKSIQIMWTNGRMRIQFGDQALNDPYDYRVVWVGVR